MKLQIKYLLIVFATVSAFGCNGDTGDKNPGLTSPTPGPTPIVDAKVQCVEKQKEALSKTGLSLSGGPEEVKKIVQREAEFYTSLPFCS